MKDIYYKSVSVSGPSWQRKVEEHAANGSSFSVRPFKKQTHWPFLEELCQRFDFVSSFDARSQTAYFDPRNK